MERIFEIFIFLLIGISVTNIITREKVFFWLRNIFKQYPKKQILNCPVCVSFWIGMLFSSIPDFLSYDLMNVFASGCILSIFVKIIGIYTDIFIEIKE